MEKNHNIPIPDELKKVSYRGNEKPKGYMSVTHQGVEPENKGEKTNEMILSAYENAYNLEKEDDFQSIIFHEYNHIRAFNREKIMDSPKPYMEKYTDMKWKELYDQDNYSEDINDHMIREMVREDVSEMLAIGEQIFLGHTKLDNSPEYLEGRYDAYYEHYIRLQTSLDTLGADQELKNELETAFYQPWFERRKIPTHELFNYHDLDPTNL